MRSGNAVALDENSVSRASSGRYQPFASQQSDDSEIRVKVVQRYRYKIFYSIPDNETVEIIHIRHTSRRPWK
jgi:plasmid stabilization system protein ParE